MLINIHPVGCSFLFHPVLLLNLLFMGFPWISIRIPKLPTPTFQNLLLSHLKHIDLMVILSRLPLLSKPIFSFEPSSENFPADDRPSPLLVPVPVNFFINVSIKKQLPIVEFGEFLERRGACKTENSVCIVCMNCMEANQELRELCNCSHVFHRECLDAWIDQGQVTCPLCRSKLLPEKGEELRKGEDPWRMERMVYLFGEDYLMGTC